MKAIPAILCLSLAGALAAQSPLTTGYAATNAAAAGGQVFFDLVVNSTITLQGFDVNLNALAGVAGSIEVRTTNAGITTYLGNELNAAQWSAAPVATGTFTSAGLDVPTPVCFTTPLTLTPGTIGVCVRYLGAGPAYVNGGGSVLPGGGGHPSQTFTTAEVTLLAGAAQNVPFTAPSFQPRVFNGSLNYVLGATGLPCSAAPAEHINYGEGCYRFQGSFWDGFNAAGASATLTGRTISFLPSGNGFVVVPGTATFIAPSGGATVLTGFVPDNDDGEVTVNLASAMPIPGGTTTTLVVHSNGMVSTGSNHASFLSSFFPQVADLLDAPFTAWYSWHDYNILEAGSGSIKFEQTGGLAIVTWDGVESYAANQVNPSTLQFQFDLASGQVNIVWQSITAINAGAASDLHLVGYSPGGASVDHGENDVSTITTLVLDGTLDQLPLTLRGEVRPVLGHTVRYVTTNETTNPGLGLNFLSVADLPPFSPAGLDLIIIGAPGCVANVDINQGVGNVISNITGFSMSVTLPIPVTISLSGLDFFSQSVWLDAAANAAGLITSNAVRTHLGTF